LTSLYARKELERKKENMFGKTVKYAEYGMLRA
jgi:hypothetical protein